MKKYAYFEDFIEEFKNQGRLDDFGIEGLRFLFNYIVDYELDTGIYIEMDAVSLCRDYTFCTYQDILSDYDTGINYTIGQEVNNDIKRKIIEYLDQNTCVVGTTDEEVLFKNF